MSPSQKYEIWLQLVRQEATIAEVAAAEQVDRSTIMRIKQVAKEGAPDGAGSVEAGSGRPASATTKLEAAKAEVARLSEACKELAVKLTLVEGKGGWG